MLKLMLAPVRVPLRVTAASVRGVAWTRSAFGRSRPRVIVRPLITTVVMHSVIVRPQVVAIPPRPDRRGEQAEGTERAGASQAQPSRILAGHLVGAEGLEPPTFAL
jgi:hypothetical protein